MKKITKDLPHYFLLFAILGLTGIGFLSFSYDKSFQVAILTAGCVSYFCWGVIHHSIHRNLNWVVVFEYFIYAVIGFLSVGFLLLSF